MGLLELLGIVVLLVLCFYVYRFFVCYKPIIHVNEQGDAAPVLARMKSLNRPYKPTPWLIESNIHTIWGMKFRPTSHFKCRREEFKFADGGTTILDWFEPPNAKEDTPIVVIIHTLAGGTREPCTNNMAMTIMKRGWRAVVANCRACSGAPITSERLYTAIEIDDLQVILKHIQEVEFKPKYTFMVGFSLGAIQTVFYAISESNIDGYAIVSHIYDSNKSALILEKPFNKKVYLPVMVQKLCRAVEKNTFITDELKQAVHARTLREFDDLFTTKNLGYKSHYEYYEDLKLHDKIAKVKAPMFILASDDDPFTSSEYQPRKEVEASEKVAMVRYKEGGHVAFNMGLNGKRSMADYLIPDWFDCLIQEKEAR